MIEFKFSGEDLVIYRRGKYQDGTPVLQIVVKDTEEPFATLTTCILGSVLSEGEYLCKNWSENAGVYDHLVKLGILVPTGVKVYSGYVAAQVCRLKPPA